jgi:hypothetical protein
VLLALGREGCPVCHEAARSDEQYFFWFLNETYYEPLTIDALTRALGFCLTHAEALMRSGAAASQVATVFELLSRRMRERLGAVRLGAEAGGGRASALRREGRCPACQGRLEQEMSTGFWLRQILEDPAYAVRYGQPGLLCFPHLQLVASRVSPPTLGRLLATHDAALRGAIDALAEGEAGLEGAPGEARPDLRKAMLPALRLAVGHERDTAAYPRLDGPEAPRPAPDPVAEFLERCEGRACPVCLEVRHAWIEWARWLDQAVSRADAVIEDLLPGCPEHVWAVVHRGCTALGRRATHRVVEASLDEIRMRTDTLAGRPEAGKGRRPLARLEEAIRGPRRRLQLTRGALARPLRCRLCERLTLAENRALALLFALLEDRRHRATVERGHGLCLNHLARALALGPAPDIVADLVAVEMARLACLQWELEEALRKSAWQFRPEARGAESTAWRRALLRFSGSLGTAWD